MDFKFNRQTSKDFLFKKSESLKSSLSTGASGMKNGLFGGFNQVQSQLDKISTKITTSLDLDDDHDDDYIEEKQRLLSEQQRQAKERERVRKQSVDSATNQSDREITRGGEEPAKPLKQKPPPKPPLPKQLSRGSIDQNGSVVKGLSGDPDLDNNVKKKKIPIPAELEHSYDEPLFNDEEGLEYSSKGNAVQAHTSAPKANYRSGKHNPFTTDIASEAETVFADIHALQDGTRDLDINVNEAHVPDLMQRRRTNPFIDVDEQLEENKSTAVGVPVVGVENGQVPPQGIKSSTLTTQLLPGIPRVPSKNNTEYLLNPASQQSGPTDLLAITPTSGAALPIPGIDPIPVDKKKMDGDQQEIYDDSDADSVATEGCDEEPNDIDYDEVEEAEMMRSASGTSDMSWSSNDSHMDAKTRECMNFMRDYTNKIFDPRLKLSPVDKSKFGQMCQHEAGRLWFSRFINSQRVQNQKVNEHTFFQLVQYFAIVLFECNDHEDYKPAKTLMNMCFRFYHEAEHPTGPPHNHYLYSYLKDQPIWQSLKFWNAAYFDAIMVERCKPVPKEAMVSGDDREYQKNITFHQLGTFTSNMRSFALAKELCLEFLRKQSVVANLTEEQMKILRENIERTPNGQNTSR